MNHFINKAWRQYEAGKAYKNRIGLYETVRRNERFYRGDQWQNGEGANLPKPVFNIVRRILDYLICSVASANLKIYFTDEDLPFIRKEKEAAFIRESLDVLSENASYRWEKNRMDSAILHLLTDAALTGDGVLYCYWDPSIRNPQQFDGDIVTRVIDNVNLFVSDVNSADLQSQDYIILSGRAPVSALRREAEEAGVPDGEREKICPDGDTLTQGGDLSKYELEDEESAKATYIIKFWREGGKVAFEKSVRDCVIRRARTDCRLYPVAYFNWMPTKNSFHGTSPVTSLIPNQKFINRAYAMAMKHMTDTAFSKVVYDKSKIPEWSNEVGQAIAAMGGGNIADAVSVIGTGEMQAGYMELIDSAVELTKELTGATESALGNMEASNTSAILALQETSRIPLEQVRSAFYQCIEDMANIWADMMCAYYPEERLLPCKQEKETVLKNARFGLLKSGFLAARVEVTEVSRFSAASTQNLLDKLLDGGHIRVSEYLSMLPGNVWHGKSYPVREAEEKKANGRNSADGTDNEQSNEEKKEETA